MAKKIQKVLTEEALKDMIRVALMEDAIKDELGDSVSELNESEMDEGVIGAGIGVLLSRFAKPLLGKICDAIGIKREGPLGRMMLSDAVIGAMMGTAGNMVGDKFGNNKISDAANNSKIGGAISSFFGGSNGASSSKPALTSGGSEMKALNEEEDDLRLGWRDNDPRMLLMNMLDDGSLNPKEVAENLVRWLSVDDAKRFMDIYEYKPYEPDDDEE